MNKDEKQQIQDSYLQEGAGKGVSWGQGGAQRDFKTAFVRL